ncbi:uncharacterized protein LOC133660545 isoform X2 [Entelurus aequoreus]|uniref:uncharacterized protein LOC133660545 isoform X2 n=1 Tax=Entelurus aequoreus TaxID=161455 RepID=UPI002B1DD6B7|nr:uncharacterized protein LOC133660545 isoform X2 [Entelurus aequoreus]
MVPVLKAPSRSLVSALGTAQILVGVFNIGLGPGRTSTSPADLSSLGAAYWLGAVFILTGILSILAGQFSSPCLRFFAALMNLVGVVFAVVALVLYAMDVENASVLWMCGGGLEDDNCRLAARFAQRLLTLLDGTLMVFAVLQLCINARLSTMVIRAWTTMVIRAWTTMVLRAWTSRAKRNQPLQGVKGHQQATLREVVILPKMTNVILCG